MTAAGQFTGSQGQIMPPTIYKYIDCSTVHITANDSLLLSRDAAQSDAGHMVPGLLGPGDGLVVLQYDEGFWVHVSEDDRDPSRYQEYLTHGYSQDLVNLLRLTLEEGCQFIRLAADGDVYNELPQHDW